LRAAPAPLAHLVEERGEEDRPRRRAVAHRELGTLTRFRSSLAAIRNSS